MLARLRSVAFYIAINQLTTPSDNKEQNLKMDPTVVTREGIDKLLNMMPTEEERGKIQEAQVGLLINRLVLLRN